MNRCTECPIGSMAANQYIGIPCCDATPRAADIEACPFCGAPRCKGEYINIVGCPASSSVYSCGSKFVVDYLSHRFVAIYSISSSCQTEEDII